MIIEIREVGKVHVILEDVEADGLRRALSAYCGPWPHARALRDGLKQIAKAAAEVTPEVTPEGVKVQHAHVTPATVAGRITAHGVSE